ncbi:type II secretion system protein [Bythopirellula goksoeyrii]|nr:prepilin-type N-terminal cleavage/methylation domain-containing protein [Bythopirellula goksoeyrii]
MRNLYTHSPFRTPHSAFRSGVTLIELLIAVAIIATLSAVFLGASRSAMESARAARTKTTIAKLHTLLMEQYASYMTRQVDIDIPSGTDPQVRNDLLVIGRRELMKYEMPDRWSDVDLLANPLNKPTSTAQGSRDRSTVVLRNVPAVARMYYRRFEKALATTNNDMGKVNQNGSAECLYLTIMLLTGDGEARTLFSPQDIGDTDEDGAPEFLDGWGNPIRWVRWPAGFALKSSLMTGDTDSDHDPFDPFHRDSVDEPTNPKQPPVSSYPSQLQGFVSRLRDNNPAFRLVPLIFSSGPDGIGDVSTRTDNITDPSTADPYYLDPYTWDTTYNAYQFGSTGDNPDDPDGDDNSIDNIHNHVIDNR